MTQDKTLRILMGASAVLFALCIGVMLYEWARYSPPTFVPAAVQMIDALPQGDDGTSAADTATEDAAAPVEAQQAGGNEAAGSESPKPAEEQGTGVQLSAEVQLVNINTAGLGVLTTLPGIGPVLGQNIIDYRERVGGFSSVDQLIYVERIGEKTLEALRPYVTV